MSGTKREHPVPPGYLLVGLIHRPHGVRGEVSVELLGDNPSRLAPGSKLVAVGGEGDISRELAVMGSRFHRGRYLVHFSGIDDRSDAESIRGMALCISESEAKPKDNQVWIKDLLDLEVVDTGGRVLGRVVDVLSYPAQDILEVETSSGTELLPLVEELVPEIDLKSGRLLANPPRGMFEADSD
jgi:16S rRNA processing protein RimM